MLTDIAPLNLAKPVEQVEVVEHVPAEPGAGGGDSAMRTAASRGALSSLASRWARTVLQLASSVVLARLLTPNDFGIIALMTVVTGLATLFQDLGLTTSAVRARTVTPAQQSSLLICNVGLGLLLTTALFLGAPSLADFYDTPQLETVARALSPVFTIGALTGQARATLQRDLRFSVLAVSEVVIGVVYFVGALGFALAGFGYWSLVGASLLSTVAWATMLLVRSPFRFTRPAPFGEVRTLLKHGVQITGVQVATYFSRSLDVVIIGRYFATSSVGLYNRASQVVSLAENQVTAAITSVSLPVLSRLQDEPARFNAFLRRAVTALGMTLVPAFFVLSLCAVPVVKLVYGSQWGTAGSLLVVLALAGTVRSLLLLIELAATALAVMGRQLVMTVTTQLVTAACLVVAARHGLTTVAVVYVVATALSVVVGGWWVSVGTQIDVTSVARTFLRPLAIWSAAYAAALIVSRLTADSSLTRSATGLAVFACVGAALLLAVAPARRDVRSVADIVSAARRRKRPVSTG